MTLSLSYFASEVAPDASGCGLRRILLITAIAGLGLALAGCTKCDVPNLWPHQAAPQSCHDGPQPQ